MAYFQNSLFPLCNQIAVCIPLIQAKFKQLLAYFFPPMIEVKYISALLVSYFDCIPQFDCKVEKGLFNCHYMMQFPALVVLFDLSINALKFAELFKTFTSEAPANQNLDQNPGYERLCCLRCMQPRDHNFQTTCVCRVPKQLREEKVIVSTVAAEGAQAGTDCMPPDLSCHLSTDLCNCRQC